MSDIVQRLRLREHDHSECIAEIERLNNIVIRGLAGVELSEENDRLIVEIKRLRALLHRWLVWNGEGRAHDLADESRRALAGEQEKMG